MILRESAGHLRARNADGTFNIVLIVESEGSMAVYPPDLMSEASAAAFENVGSHPGHPVDHEKPEHRSPMGLIGRVIDVHPGEDRGKRALLGKFKPGNDEVASYVEEFADLLAVSIYAQGRYTEYKAGKPVIHAFVAAWPYTSVDIVLAAGAGGRFQLAQESFLAIESTAGAASATARTAGGFSITQFAAGVGATAATDPDPGAAHSFAVHVSPLRNY